MNYEDTPGPYAGLANAWEMLDQDAYTIQHQRILIEQLRGQLAAAEYRVSRLEWAMIGGERLLLDEIERLERLVKEQGRTIEALGEERPMLPPSMATPPPRTVRRGRRR